MDASQPDALRDKLFPGDQRRPRGPLGFVVAALAVTLAVVTLYMAFRVSWGPVITRAFHLLFAIPLTFLLYPAAARWRDRRPGFLDYALATATAAAFGWAIWSAERFETRYAYYDPVENADLVFAVIALLVVSEATRRTMGMTIVWLNLVFILYALTGPLWPGLLQHKGTSFTYLMEHLYMLSDGLFNFITGIQATFLFTFLTFSAFLRASGGDRVFADLALAVAGHRRGGPAKVAVASSALMGMLSGSTVSNVATTGTLTIPMMVRSGFRPLEAAAIETSASVGGALMPPVMGAGVFLMAAFTGVPLVTILTYSFLPAVLYFASVYFYVDVKARKRGIPPLPRESLGRVGGVLKEGGYLFVPIAVLTYLLLADYTPFFASSACVLMVVAVSYLRRETRLTPRKLLITLEASTRAVLTLSALAASSAIMYGVLTATGLLVKMTSIVLALAGGSLFVCLLYVALMSYVVGLSLPVTASYVLIAALGASALTELGLSTLAAHLVIFWFSQDATITPPVCMTAFVAARIAGTPPMRTGWESVRVAKALYVVPFLFAYGSLLSRSVTEVLFDFGAVFLGFALIPMVVEGFYRTKLDRLERVLFGLASGSLFLSALGPMSDGYRWLLAAVGSAGLAHVLSRKRAAESVASVGSGAAGS